jgi:hypothetical protein
MNAWWCSYIFSTHCAYNGRWIGRGGPTAWPPRSPDLNSLDFYLSEHLKSLMYAAPVDNEEALHHRTVGVSDYPQLPRHLWTDCDGTCRGVHLISWRPFWTLILNVRFSCNSQIKCFRTHADMDIYLFWYAELVPKVCPHLSVTTCILPQVIYQTWYITRHGSAAARKGIYGEHGGSTLLID